MKTPSIPNPQEILFLKGVINYTEFHFKNGKKLVTSYTLKRYEDLLDGFLRVNKSHLLNPNFISKVFTDGTTKGVQLKTGQKVKVSRRREGVLDEIQK